MECITVDKDVAEINAIRAVWPTLHDIYSVSTHAGRQTE
jgi:hypothetical protein